MPGTGHTGSYYAATRNDQSVYEPLCGEHRADVCVIGAGFTGISTALHLAERGYDVRVVEARRVGWGASGRNGGQMIGGIAGEKHIPQVRLPRRRAQAAPSARLRDRIRKPPAMRLCLRGSTALGVRDP